MALADDKRSKADAQSGRPLSRERGGWLAKIAPGVRKLVARRETPENLWVKCPDTGEMIYRPDLEAALWVTPAGRHMRIGPALRFAYTFDGGRHRDLPLPQTPDDPLGFTYGKPYRDSLAIARKTTGEIDAMAAAVGEIGGVRGGGPGPGLRLHGRLAGRAAGEAFLTAARRGGDAVKSRSWSSPPRAGRACRRARCR